jgi:hypothetical protein
MGGEYNTHGKDGKWIQNFGRKIEDLDVDGRIILEWILENRAVVECIHLA